MWVILALFYFGFAVAGQTAFGRVWRLNSVFSYLVPGTLCGMALIVHGFFYYAQESRVLAAALFYALLSELYLFLFTFFRSSVSVALLMTMEPAPLTRGQIDATFCEEDMVKGRIQTMQYEKFIESDGGVYHLTKKGKIMADLFRGCKEFFKIQESL